MSNSLTLRSSFRTSMAMVSVLVGIAPALAQTTGKVRVDGSSTVAPIINAAASLYEKQSPGVKVPVGVSGTGGGFKKFLDASPDLRTDINNASRHIKQSELDLAKSAGVEFVEVPIAMDGMAVVVNPKNNFCDHLTIEELKRIWQPGSTINNWSQVRAGFPDLPMKLYGPGPDSGTFDYWTEAVVGKEKSSRTDYSASENDNALVLGVSGDAGALGYFGFSYYEANKGKLKLLAIDNGDGKPLKPSLETIRDGSYSPLSRPLFLYINNAALDRPEVKGFLSFFFKEAKKIVEHPRVAYVALSDELYTLAAKRVENRVTGSALAGSGSIVNINLQEIYGGKK